MFDIYALGHKCHIGRGIDTNQDSKLSPYDEPCENSVLEIPHRGESHSRSKEPWFLFKT